MDIEAILKEIIEYETVDMTPGELRNVNIDEFYPGKSIRDCVELLFIHVEYHLKEGYTLEYDSGDGQPTIGMSSAFYLVKGLEKEDIPGQKREMKKVTSLKTLLFGIESDDSVLNFDENPDNRFGYGTWRKIGQVLEIIKQAYEQMEAFKP